LIRERALNIIYISGPGHGGPAVVAQVYLEGTYSEYYPEVTQDIAGMGSLFKQFSFPGGIPSHIAPETPGSMHAGGELGYSLSHAYGAVLDKPNLMVACVIGDGEAETGPLATSWHANKFLNPATDGAVLPILHLNGYKIANPAVLARIPEAELISLFVGYGYEPIIVKGSDPGLLHPAFAEALDTCANKIKAFQEEARSAVREGKNPTRPTWPMIILRTPKGWTGPKKVDGLQIEDSYRSHQIPVPSPATHPAHLKLLEDWLRSYEPDKQFDENGTLLPELRELVPPPDLRMGENPFTNPKVKPLILPDFDVYGIAVQPNARGQIFASDTYTCGVFLRDVIVKNQARRNFRIFSPDETVSNRLHAVFEVTKKQWMGEYLDTDDGLAPDGRVLEILSEHQCEGWLEGYLLTGGHGLLNCYEAFIRIISSMFNQHAKWLKMCNSLNILLTSHVWVSRRVICAPVFGF
jgi:xylulose-5-phosphate/fructose-6-phosphate phosphoketolase